ncbi:MAG: DUF4175 family protein [Candidatus Zixiibacteriota bacterium]
MDPRISLEYLSGRLQKLRNFILLGHAANGVLLILTALAALLALGFLFNAAFFMSTTFRIIFVSGAVLVFAALIFRSIILPVVKKPTTEDVALKVEEKYPQLQDRLIASLQLEKNLAANREGFSTDMIQAIIQQSRDMCKDFDFKKSVDHSYLKRSLRYFSASALIVLVLGFVFPSVFSETVFLLTNPTLDVARQLTYNLDVNPKNIEVAKFAPVTVEALLSGKSLPQDAKLHWRYEDGPVKSEDFGEGRVVKAAASGIAGKLASDDTTTLSFEFREVRRSFEYWVTAGEIESPKYQIEAVDKPRIMDIKLTYNYPKYTGMQPLVVDENDGNISAIKGAEVRIEATSNKPPQTALLVLKNGQTLPLQINDHKLATNLKVMDDGSYHIAITDELGNDNPSPIEYRIGAIADAFPEADLYAPGVPVNLGDDMALDLGVKLFDDFGFSSLNLNYRIFSIQGETFASKFSVPFDRSAGKSIEVHYPWNLGDIGLEPGGWVEYQFEVFDNDNITGPKSALSQLLVARLPSLDEQFAYLEEEGEAQISDLEKLRQTQEQLLQNTEKLQEELLSNKDMDWEKKQELQKAMAQQQDLMEAMEKIGDRMEEMKDQMQKNDLTSLEIMQKMQELQKLFEQVATPEMKEAMRKMQEALEKMSPEEMQKAAEQMEMSQEDLKEKLERTIAMLKFMQAQQKMENMMRQLEDLIEKQQAVNEQTEKSPDQKLAELSPREQQNKKDLDEFQKQADELEKMLQELKLNEQKDAQEFLEASRKPEAGQQMQQMSEQLSQKNKKSAQQSGEQAMNSLEQMQKQMQEMKDSFNNEQGQKSAEKMKEAANEILYVSDKQEDVIDRAEAEEPTSPQLQQLAAEQQALQRTMESLDAKLKQISMESPFYSQDIGALMDKAREAMNQSTEDLMKRNGSNAMRSQKDAMFSLNQAANQLMQSTQSQQMCNNGRCNNENMFQKMNKLSKQQKQLNNNTSSMCDKPGNAKPSQGDLGRLAAEQNAVRKSLGELQKEQGNRKEILGRLDELDKEVKKVVEDLEGGNVTESTLERQNKIHSRMLDFQRSLERQDFSEERKAESAKDILRASPEQLKFESIARQSYQDRLQKYMNEGYPPEYEELIKEYFRSVNANQPNK